MIFTTAFVKQFSVKGGATYDLFEQLELATFSEDSSFYKFRFQ